MADSVKQHGVLVPGLARPKANGGHEMIAGHRRKKASELAGMDTMPCIVREMDDDAATIIMVDSNLQRESILPMKKLAYKIRLEAINRQGHMGDASGSDKRFFPSPFRQGIHPPSCTCLKAPSTNTNFLIYVIIYDNIMMR